MKKPEYLARFHSTRCSYSHEFTVLRGVLGSYASRHNRNYALPFLKEHVADLKVREKPEITKDLTVEQMQKFLLALYENVQGTEYEVIYYLALMQYLIYGRIQEAAALHFESFDFVGNKIRVDKKVQWIRKAGKEDRIVDGAKASSGKTLDMSGHAARVFKEWTLKSGVRSGPLFLLDGNHPVPRDRVSVLQGAEDGGPAIQGNSHFAPRCFDGILRRLQRPSGYRQSGRS